MALVSIAAGDSTSGGSSDSSMESRIVGGKKLKRKAVDVDLRGWVLDWFLEPEWYAVESAGDGLVCVRSNIEYHHFAKLVEPQGDCWQVRKAADREWEPTKPWVDRFCVLNPLTRTCVVLPPIPFLSNMYSWYPPVVTGTCGGAGGAAATFVISVWCHGTKEMPTYRSGGGAQWRVVAYHLNAPKGAPPVDAVLGGQAYHYDLDEGRVYVVAAAAEEDGAVPVPRWPWTTRTSEEVEERPACMSVIR